VGTPKHAAAKLSGKYGIVDQSLVLDKCDYVMVFPLWTGASRRVHTTGNGRDMKLHWDEEVDGLELARRIFRDPCKQHLLEEEGLEEWVSSKMTFENYNSAVRQLLVKLLGGPKFGLDMEKFASYDLDEVFLTIRLPRKENGLRQYAAHFSYSMPLSDFAYEQIDMKVPKDEHGRTMRTYAHFLPDYLQYFENFRQADKLRLLDAQLEKYINVEALMKQNILADHFNAHYWRTVDEMSEEWGNPWQWYKMPKHNDEDHVRAYFGEEVAWIFVWQTMYSRALLFPATLGVLVYLRWYLVPTPVANIIQLAFAGVMAAWVSMFNGHYLRYEARVRHRWGMERYAPPIYVRDAYDPAFDGSKRVLGAKIFSDLLALAMICVVIAGVIGIQDLQRYCNHRAHVSWATKKLPILLVTMQIFVVDRVWFTLSKKIVENENHKTKKHFMNSWAGKLFFVRIINSLFPFIYQGFIKEYMHEPCPANYKGCHMADLEVNLCVYFAAMLMKMMVSEIAMVFFTRRQIASELHGSGAHKRDYSYIEVQAKSPRYSDEMQMDDWTELVIAFAFLACFNVVLPAIAPIAFLASLVRYRCMAYRNISILRRPVPAGAPGIGSWAVLCEIISIIAVIVNCAFASFAMQPVRDFHPTTQWICFVSSQYALFLLKLLIRDKFPELPRDIEDLQRLSSDVIRKVFLDSEAHVVDVQREEQTKIDIGPRSFSYSLSLPEGEIVETKDGNLETAFAGLMSGEEVT
jgi:hypothetical protein